MANTNGSEAALNIAFQDLKRRYLAQRNELNFLRQQSTLNGADQNNPTTSYVLEKKIEQLCKSLETKTSAYKSLENMYVQTRENEEYLLKHTQQIEELLVKTLEKTEIFQKQNSQLREDQESLVFSFYQIEKGREKANEPQEICMSTFSHADSSKTLSMETKPVLSTGNEDCNSLSTVHLPKVKKQIDCLLSEKKALQTKILLLTKELRVEKEKNESLKGFKNVTKTRGSSEGDSASEIMFRSIKILHEKINLLQNMLKRNSEILNKLTSKFTKIKHDVEEPVILTLNSHHNYELPPLEQINPVFLQNFISGDSTKKDPFYEAEHSSDNCLDESKQTSLLQYFQLTFPIEKGLEKSS